MASIESIADIPANGGDREEMRVARQRLEALLVPQEKGRGADTKVPASMNDEDLVNALAQYLERDRIEVHVEVRRRARHERVRQNQAAKHADARREGARALEGATERVGVVPGEAEDDLDGRLREEVRGRRDCQYTWAPWYSPKASRSTSQISPTVA